jgi:serine/threonine protein phosphatase PrpC
MQGWRATQEDTHIMQQVTLKRGEIGMLFGVFDGHSGSQVSRYLKHNFAKTF